MNVAASYVGVILIWSTTALALKWSGEGAGFLFGVAGRMAIGALLSMALLGLLRQRLPLHRRALHTYVAAASGIFGAMLCVYWGAQYIPSGLVAVLFGLTPISTGVVAALWLAERSLTPSRLTGIVISLAGLVLIFHADLALGDDAWKGFVGALAAVFLHSFSMVWVKRLHADLPALAISTGGMLVSVLLYGAVWLASGAELPLEVPPRTALSILYLAVFGSVLGFLLYYHALKHLSAGAMALVTLITPVLALFIGRTFNDEHLPLDVWYGTALVLGGLIFHQWGGQWLRRMYGASVVGLVGRTRGSDRNG
ncbi:MAG: DMT family transporter [Chromatiales bacterium]|jgi:drug/metabolite transporter (DMT)-like permease|nr:DMT family transporter [Chromatiales bacterium]